MTGSLTERYDDRIAGALSCYDRVVVTGTLPTVCYAAGMTKFLCAIGVRIFDRPQFASTLRDRVRPLSPMTRHAGCGSAKPASACGPRSARSGLISDRAG